MLQITNLRQGAVLNHNHGRETANALTIRLEGLSDMGYPVTINGIPANMDGRRFQANIDLTKPFNTVTAAVNTPYGLFSQELTLVWDKQSFKRCNFFLDDHSFTFTDLAKQRPRHAFDHFYLAWLKRLHDQYGLKISLNCFYRNDHDGFELKDMPDIWKSEFIDNSDWLRFAFHAYSEFPDRPYAEATAAEFGRDWDLVESEIARFAGRESIIVPVVIHWANVHPAVAQEAIRRGVRCYNRTFRLRVMGGPSLSDRQKGGDMASVEQHSLDGTDRVPPSTALNLHYGSNEDLDYLQKNVVYYDPNLKIFFQGMVCCSNLTPLAKYPELYAAAARNNQEKGIELLQTGGHEQYSFPYYSNYQPDHLQRLEAAIRLMTEAGYKPVFFQDGMLGNTAWNL